MDDTPHSKSKPKPRRVKFIYDEKPRQSIVEQSRKEELWEVLKKRGD